MSSYKTSVLKDGVKISNKLVHVSDRAISNEDDFKKNVVQQFIDESKARVDERERQIMAELDEKKMQIMMEAYLEGQQKATEDALVHVKGEWQDEFQKVSDMYEKANQYYINLVNEANELRNRFFKEKKDDVVEFVVNLFNQLLNQQMDKNDINLESMYEHIMNQINHETKKVYLRVNPKMLQLVRQTSFFEKDVRIHWLSDVTLDVADYVVETDREFIDMTIQTQIKEIMEVMRSVIHGEDGFNFEENQE